MPRCLVSFGANIGDPLATIRSAAVALQEATDCPPHCFQMSGYYRTPPVGGPGGQPPFVNAVVAIETQRSVWEVWEIVRRLEFEFGRQRNQRWEARKLDLDILLYDTHRIWTPQLKVPHPRMCMRRFILVPAAEVAGDWLEPVSGQTVAALELRLRTAPASLCLLAADRRRGTHILQAVARQALAEWRSGGAKFSSQHQAGRSSAPALDPHARWVELMEEPEHCFALKGWPFDSNLAVVLAAPVEQDGVCWEDYHGGLAARLNLQKRPHTEPCDWTGARYLLAGDDQEWAIHELAAALDAMDCPVERIDD